MRLTSNTKPLDLSALLAREGVQPVLVDVGASGGSPQVWAPIASQCIYVGFDPDAREMREDAGGAYSRALIINLAVTVIGGSRVPYYFTRSPYCSSTLRPVAESLAEYTFAPLFDVVRQGTVDTVSLDAVVDQHSLRSVDWLKLDTQGTDLRIFGSLRPELRERMIAVDIEPGLIDAYEGEDLFVDVHRSLCQEGFWLSNLNIGGAIRLRPATLDRLVRSHVGVNAQSIDRRARRSPAWCEARYLRTLDSISTGEEARRDHVLLAIFAILDSQWGFAYDAIVELEGIFGSDQVSEELKQACARALADSPPTMTVQIRNWLSAGLRAAFRRLSTTR